MRQVSSPKDQQQYWIREEPWKYVPGDAFVEAYSRHRTGQNIQAHLAQPFDQAKHKPESLITTKFALNGKQRCLPCNESIAVLLEQQGHACQHLTPGGAGRGGD